MQIMLEPSTSNQSLIVAARAKGRGAGGVLSINSYKKATRGILEVIEIFCILILVVDIQTYTCDLSAEN